MSFSFDTKPNLSYRKFEQLNNETLNLSGVTNVFGSLCVKPVGVIDSYSGYKLSGDTFLDSSPICKSSIFLGVNSGSNNRGCNEIAIGYNSLYCSSGNTNIGIGCNSLCSNTTGINNIGIGSNTLLCNTNSSCNIAIGDNSLCANKGSLNIGIGNSALKNNISGTNNIGIGNRSLYNNITGLNNIGLGVDSFLCNTCGCDNIGIGLNSFCLNISGNTNIGIGISTLINNKGGCNNIGLGANSLYSNTFGNYNIGIGYSSLKSNVRGVYNTAIGDNVLYLNTCGNYNIGIGSNSLSGNTLGISNVGIGYNSLQKNLTGCYNLGIGENTLCCNTIGCYNMAFGYNTLLNNNTGCNNVGIGYNILRTNSNGCNNVGLGYNVLYNNTCGCNNIALGFCSLCCNTVGVNNIGIGYGSLRTNTNGNGNISIGCFNLYCNISGSNNVSIGTCAGYTETGSNKFYVANSATCNLIYGDFTGNTITLPKLKLCETPLSGVNADDFLVWNSTDKSVKKINISGGIVNTVTGHTVSINSLLNERTITKETTGFVNCDDVVVTYNKTNRTITLTGSFSAYYKGELISILTNGWTSDPHPVGNGIFFLYYGDSGFVFDNTPWTFDKLQIAYVQVNSHQIGMRETHGFMPWQAHKEFHQRIGTYLTAGGTLVTNSYQLNSTTAANRRPDVNTTTIQDEDLATTLLSLTSKTYTQRRITGAATRVFTTNQPEIIYSSGNTVYYDYNNNGTWSKAIIPNNNYAAIYLVAIPVTADADSQLFRYVWVQPQTYGTLQAIKAITPNNLTLGDPSILLSEFVFIDKIIINVVGNNWSIYSVELLTGDKSNQTSSPSGNYLTTVNTDSTLSGNGTIITPLTLVGTHLYANSVTGATNGITKSGYKVKLGGALTGNTTITGAYTLSLCSGALMNTQCGYQISGNTILNIKQNDNIFLGLTSGLHDNASNSCNNIGIGKNTLNSYNIGDFNIGIGNESLANSTSHYNIGIGNGVLNSNNSYGNTSVGYASMAANTSGYDNVVVGRHGLANNVTGSNNVAIGAFSGYYFCCDFLGSTCGSCNIYIGSCSKSLNNNSINQIVIGHNAVGNGNNSVMLGNNAITTTVLNGNIKMLTTPVTGSVGDSYLVWNSTDKCVKSISCASIISGATVTANNGLTKIGQNVRLGGALTGNTTITGAYTLSLCNGALMNTQCGYQISGNTILKTHNTSMTSIYIGCNSGVFTGNTFDNTGIGGMNMCNIKDGCFNVGVGYSSLRALTYGCFNVGIGISSQFYNYNGCNNVSVGSFALRSNVSGCSNVVIGTDALYFHPNSVNNIVIGCGAGYSLDCGNNNIIIGTNAVCNIGEMSNKLIIANTCLCNLIYGDFTGNTVTLPKLKLCETPQTGSVGDSYLVWNSTDKCVKSISCASIISGVTTTANNGLTKIGQNVRLGGILTGDTYITGNYILSFCNGSKINSNLGYQISGETIFKTTPNTNNTSIFIGVNSGIANLSENNIGVGCNVLRSNTSGCENIGIGGSSLFSNVNGERNIGIGIASLYSNVSGLCNVAIGDASMICNQTGCSNTAVGESSLFSNRTGCFNTAMGEGSLASMCFGCSNTAVGESSLRMLVSGSYNTAIGADSLASIPNNGSCNLALGFLSGFQNQGSGNVFIGYMSGANNNSSNKLYIANTCLCNLIYGDFTGNTVTLPKLKLCETPATGAASDCFLVWNATDKCVKMVACPAGGSGEANTASNLGTGCGIYSSKSGVDLRFKSLKAGNNISMSSDANEITICSTGSGGVSTANNGLNVIGSNVRLGGALTGDTCIMGGYTLSICDAYLNVNNAYYYDNTPILSYYGSHSISLGNYNGNHGTNSVSIGNNILCSDCGTNNIGIGNNIGSLITDSQYNLFIGNGIADSITEGTENIGIGFNIYKNTTSISHSNILIGSNIFDSNNCILLNNIMIGRYIASSNNDYCNNIMIGEYAGSNAKGNDNVFIGNYAGCSEVSENRLYISNYNNSQLIYGEFDNDVVTLPYLCLRQTPSAGSTSDSLLVWNSTDKSVRTITNNTNLWTPLSATRASNTTITVTGDQTSIFKKGMIVTWKESGVNKVAMVSIPSTYSSPNTTITLVGDTCASIDVNSFKYSNLFDINQFKQKFVIAGNIGATATNAANVFYADEPYRVLGSEIYVDTIGTTNSTTVSLVNNTGTVTLTSPSLTTVAYNATPTAPASSGLSLALNDKVRLNITAVHTTTPSVGLYVHLLLFPTRFLDLA